MGNGAEYAEVVRRLGPGRAAAVVDRVFPMDRIREAYSDSLRTTAGESGGGVSSADP